MTYFDCFMAGAWMFALGWFLGAIYLQNRIEETEIPRESEQPEQESEVLWVPAVASGASAD
jgi:hypothetical protein